MPRAKGGVVTRRRHKKILKMAKGFYSANSRSFIHAKEKLDRSLVYQYRDRKVRKRMFRRLWTQRINAAARLNGTTYSKLIGSMAKAGVEINRKVLSDMAITNPQAFTDLVKQVSK
jgi:large subunit ribosomal protein L20